MAVGLNALEVAAKMGLCGATVRFWLKRFNARGLAGLEEDMRSGRPPTGLPRVVRGSAAQAATASSLNQTVRFPRWRSPAS